MADALLSDMLSTAAKPGVLVIAPVNVPNKVSKFIDLVNAANNAANIIGNKVSMAPTKNSLEP